MSILLIFFLKGGRCEKNASGTIEFPRLSLYGFPKLMTSFARIRFSILSLNSAVLGSKNPNGKTSSLTDQFGEPSAAVVAVEKVESLQPYPTTDCLEKSRRPLNSPILLIGVLSIVEAPTPTNDSNG